VRLLRSRTQSLAFLVGLPLTRFLHRADGAFFKLFVSLWEKRAIVASTPSGDADCGTQCLRIAFTSLSIGHGASRMILGWLLESTRYYALRWHFFAGSFFSFFSLFLFFAHIVQGPKINWNALFVVSWQVDPPPIFPNPSPHPFMQCAPTLPPRHQYATHIPQGAPGRPDTQAPSTSPPEDLTPAPLRVDFHHLLPSACHCPQISPGSVPPRSGDCPLPPPSPRTQTHETVTLTSPH